MLQHDFLGFDIWPKAQTAWQLPALTRPGCETPAAYLHVQTNSVRPAPELNPHLSAGRAIHVPLCLWRALGHRAGRAPSGGSWTTSQCRTQNFCFWTKKLVSHLTFDTMKSELGPLLDILPSRFWAGFHLSQFLCTGFHKQLNHRLWTEVQCTYFTSSQPLHLLPPPHLRRLVWDYD